MPTLTIDNTPVQVPAGKRLVKAIEEDGKIDQLHNCGGKAACTTCRVHFVAGEPEKMTEAEKGLLQARGLLDQPGVRLSCQITTDADMSVQIISRQAGSGRPTTGNPCSDSIEPPPVWTTR